MYASDETSGYHHSTGTASGESWLRPPYPEDMVVEREFDVVLEVAEEGGFVVSVPDLPGCWTQGETREEALANAREAIVAYLAALDELGRPRPKPKREHVKISA